MASRTSPLGAAAALTSPSTAPFVLPASLIEQLVADSEERRFPVLTPRKTRVPSLDGKAHVIVGMRRVGKTCLALRTLADEFERGAAPSARD